LNIQNHLSPGEFLLGDSGFALSGSLFVEDISK
jgi:hypothetical protein